MTAPNVAPIAPMPEPGGVPADTGPKFEAPKPSFVARTSMKLAGVALGLGRKADPSTTVTKLVTQVGGYEPNLHDGKQTPTFVKAPEKARYKRPLEDETSRGGPGVRDYANAADFTEESTGLFLDGAASRVTQGQRARSGHLTARERAARSLVKVGTARNGYRNLQPSLPEAK